MTAATLILNCGVLIILVKEKNLRTPFNVYVIVLLCSNLLYVGLNNIMMIMAPFGQWWIGDQACTLELYCRYIVITINIHSHVLVSVNRAWALFWPVSYKNNHTFTVAWLLCLGMVVYVHACQLPGLVLDALYYRVPVQVAKICRFNKQAQLGFSLFSSIWVFDVPKLFIPVCYPILLWKFLRRNNAIHGRSAIVNRTELARRRDHVLRPFILLTMITCSAAVCWIPIMVYYIAVDFVRTMRSDRLEIALIVLYSVEPILDPVFFGLSISNLHNYVVSFWKTKVAYKGTRRATNTIQLSDV
ncbi:neuropeptide Y receptor type 1-like [Paramacrobiotus metropolitanus]|uniref:neuropeptide Y receptor type 1-like n=1 Tax=Paramacrobiotus metropolitanus TaxID=2943436 RepID=UPI002445790D|nr:neuropeptide Y receptor type 1-like [Paramacrobiotus metropolitanus]